MPDRVAAVVLAAGRGTRAGSGGPKQYRNVQGAPVICHALALFVGHPDIDMVQPVIHGDDAAPFAAATSGLRLQPAVLGGDTRQASVRAGLEALLHEPPQIVLVHDAARPFASPSLISRAVAAGAGGRQSPPWR